MVYVYKGNKKRLPDKPQAQPKRKPKTYTDSLGRSHTQAECGTYKGYRNHIANWEKACKRCRIAYSEYRGFEGRLHNMEEPDCGTEPGYKRHLYKKEPTCGPCKKAHSEYVTKMRKKAKAKYRND